MTPAATTGPAGAWLPALGSRVSAMMAPGSALGAFAVVTATPSAPTVKSPIDTGAVVPSIDHAV